MQIQEVEEVDEIGTGQRRSRDVVCWQCGEKEQLQRDSPHKIVEGQDDDIDDPNAYAGKSEQIIRITQPITVATRDNIYKQWVHKEQKLTCTELVIEKLKLPCKSSKELMQPWQLP